MRSSFSSFFFQPFLIDQPETLHAWIAFCLLSAYLLFLSYALFLSLLFASDHLFLIRSSIFRLDAFFFSVLRVFPVSRLLVPSCPHPSQAKTLSSGVQAGILSVLCQFFTILFFNVICEFFWFYTILYCITLKFNTFLLKLFRLRSLHWSKKQASASCGSLFPFLVSDQIKTHLWERRICSYRPADP